MSVVNPSTSAADSWDFIPPAQRPLAVVAARKSQDVPDDWDAEDVEDEEPQKLWETANRAAPMPELVVSSSTSSAAPPPAAAFKPSLRILKRPTASSSSSSATSSASDTQQRTYAEREAQYQAARERIFGSGSGSSTPTTTPPPERSKRNNTNTRSPGLSSSSELSSPALTPSATVLRNPRGPDSNSQETSRSRGPDSSRGFASRRGGARQNVPGRGPDSKTRTPPG